MDKLTLLEEANNIIELFTFDLTTFFFEDDFEEIDSHEEKGVFMVEYKKNLPWVELNLFDQIVFRIFNDKENLIGSSHINASFPANKKYQNETNLSELTNNLFNLYGWDDDSLGSWTTKDSDHYKKNAFKRIWTLGEGKFIYTVKLIQNSDGDISLHIMLFNHLLKLTNKSISSPSNEFGS